MVKNNAKTPPVPAIHSVARNLLSIIWPFIVIVATLFVIDHLSSSILLAARAYSSAESDWSKAQKDAVVNLERYAQTRQESYYEAYLENMQMLQGDSMARMEMEKPVLDSAKARLGLEQGRVHHDDVADVIVLSRTFGWLPFMRQALQLWREADVQLLALDGYATDLHHEIQSHPPNAVRIAELGNKINEIDATLSPIARQFATRMGDGARQVHQILGIARPVIGVALLLIGIALSYRMVLRSHRVKEALRQSEERYQLATEGGNDGVWDWNLLEQRLYFSPRAKALLGYADDELEGDPSLLFDFVHVQDIDGLRESLSRHLREGTPHDVEARYRTRRGVYRWFNIRGSAIRNADGKAARMTGVITDIDDRKRAETQLFTEKERAQVTLASIGEAVITTDQEGLIEYMNPVAEKLTGWDLEEARSLPPRRVCPMTNDGTPRQILDPVEKVLHGTPIESTNGDVLLIGRDGSDIAIKESVAPIRNRENEIVGAVLVLRDVRSERVFAAQLSYQARHDELTGLLNRREFESRLARNLADRVAAGPSAMLYLDLDQFKIVNDTCGHRAGDELMRQIGMLLQSCLRAHDALARIGGDEFGVLLEHCPQEEALRIADSLCRAVSGFRYTWGERQFSVGISIGFVQFAPDMRSIADLLSAGDSACYLAKEKGRGRVQVYRATDRELSLMRGEVEWVARINAALETGHFCLYVQRFSTLQESAPGSTHCELLLRMLDHDGSIIPPMAFIPAAHRYNLISAIDRWVVRSAFTTIAAIQASPQNPGGVYGINLSGPSIGDQQFFEFLLKAAEESGVEPDSICFEITETEAIANLRSATRFMQELSTRGFRFALDDFGAGMSSFGYLKHLPVHYIKIDGSFVTDLMTDAIGEAMVVAINDIGHLMGKRTIAECVQDDACLQRLRELGVDFAQGYCVARPELFSADSFLPDPALQAVDVLKRFG